MREATEHNDIYSPGPELSFCKDPIQRTTKSVVQILAYKAVSYIHLRLRRQVEWAESIPEDTPCIICTSHLTDYDVVIIADDMDSRTKEHTVIVSQATNLEIPWAKTFLKPLGEGKFLPISNRKAEQKIQGSEWDYDLTMKDYQAFERAVNNNNSLVIAWHRPTHDGKLPPESWIWGIITAYLTGKPLIPATVDHDKKLFAATLSYKQTLELPELTPEEDALLRHKVKNNERLHFSEPKSDTEDTLTKKITEAADALLDVYKDHYKKDETQWKKLLKYIKWAN